MKRILTLTLVGILLLPSLFACGAEAPQATVTAPDTAAPETAPSETPAIEIGESGSTNEECGIKIVEHAWSAEEASFVISVQKKDAWDVRCKTAYTIQRLSDSEWEAFIDYTLPYPKNFDHVHNYKGSNQLVIGLTDVFDQFENGQYRFILECNVAAPDFEGKVTAQTWCDFTVTGMPPKAAAEKRNDVAFSVQAIRGAASKNAPAIQIIRSYPEFKARYSSASLSEELSRYDEAYFQNQVLLLVMLYEPSGSNRHVTDFVKKDAAGKLYIGIHTVSPELFTEDIATWGIFIEPAPGITVENESDVVLYLNGYKIDEPSQILPPYNLYYTQKHNP